MRKRKHRKRVARETLRSAILEIVQNQMRDGTPPETRETFDRLVAEGHSPDEAMRLIGCVVTAEIVDIQQQGQPFDQQRFIRSLHALPKLPWDEPAS